VRNRLNRLLHFEILWRDTSGRLNLTFCAFAFSHPGYRNCLQSSPWQLRCFFHFNFKMDQFYYLLSTLHRNHHSSVFAWCSFLNSNFEVSFESLCEKIHFIAVVKIALWWGTSLYNRLLAGFLWKHCLSQLILFTMPHSRLLFNINFYSVRWLKHSL
jgi:hypothetical protein